MASSKNKKNASIMADKGIHPVSVFGRDMYVEGNVYSKVDIRVDGIVDGQIECEGRVIMGNESYLELIKLTTDSVNINGTLAGEIIASSGIVIGERGKVTGDLNTPKLQVKQGGLVNGKITMTSNT